MSMDQIARTLGAVVATRRIDPYHVQTISQVFVSPDPNDGEVYTSPSFPGVALAKPALMKILQAAGGRVIDTRPVPELCRGRSYGHIVTVSVPSSDGSHHITMSGTYEMDLESGGVIEEELRARPKATDQSVAKEILRLRKSRVPLCETKAMLRAIRAKFGLRANYQPAALREPFMIPQTRYSPDWDNELVRQLEINRGQLANEKLFPESPKLALTSGSIDDDDLSILSEVVGSGDMQIEEPPLEQIRQVAEVMAEAAGRRLEQPRIAATSPQEVLPIRMAATSQIAQVAIGCPGSSCNQDSPTSSQSQLNTIMAGIYNCNTFEDLDAIGAEIKRLVAAGAINDDDRVRLQSCWQGWRNQLKELSK